MNIKLQLFLATKHSLGKYFRFFGRKVHFLLFAVFSFLNIDSYAQEWLNPRPSGYQIVDIDFVDARKGFLINESQIFSTEDSGLTWKLHQNLPQTPVDIDFTGNTGCIVGENGLVYMTSDAGGNWVSRAIGIFDHLNSVTVLSTDTILISSSEKIIKTFDGGQTWQVLIQNQGVVNRSVFTDGNTGHAVCNNGKILKTINGGLTWKVTVTSNISPSDYLAVHFVNSKVGFASRSHDHLYKTIDGGETWSEIPNTMGAILRFFFLDENRGYIAGHNGVFNTSDGGNTWTQLRRGGIIGTLYFFDSENGIAAGSSGLLMNTQNSGETWSSAAFTYHDILGFDAPKGNTLYALSDELWKSSNNGESWSKLETGVDKSKEYFKSGQFLSADTGFIFTQGTYEDRLLKTTDGGITWNHMLSGRPRVWVSSIFFLNSKVGFACGGHYEDERHFSLTTDGGLTWDLQSTHYPFSQLWFIDINNGFALGGGDLYQTSDSGKSWVKIKEIDGDLNKIFFVNRQVGYIGGDNSTVLKTVDGGKRWVELKTDDGSNYDHIKGICFLNEKVGYVVGAYGTFQTTADGGLSWTSKQVNHGATTLTIRDNILFMSGRNGAILREALNIPVTQEIPIISLILPEAAATGDTVTISGSNFTNVATVSFGDTQAAIFQTVSSGQIKAVIGSGASGEVKVTTLGGSATKAGFTFIPAPIISSISPSTAAAGDTVIISGSNLDSASGISFGDIQALSFQTASSGQIKAVIGLGASGEVKVTTSGGSATKEGFTFIPAPTITSVSPSTAVAGDTVTISGSNLGSASRVSFGDIQTPSFHTVSSNQIRAVIGSGASGEVKVTTPGGSASKAVVFFLSLYGNI